MTCKCHGEQLTLHLLRGPQTKFDSHYLLPKSVDSTTHGANLRSYDDILIWMNVNENQMHSNFMQTHHHHHQHAHVCVHTVCVYA